MGEGRVVGGGSSQTMKREKGKGRRKKTAIEEKEKK